MSRKKSNKKSPSPRDYYGTSSGNIAPAHDGPGHFSPLPSFERDSIDTERDSIDTESLLLQDMHEATSALRGYLRMHLRSMCTSVVGVCRTLVLMPFKLAYRAVSLVLQLVCTCARTVAVCCALACVTVVLAAVTAGLIHLWSGIGSGGDDGMGGVVPEHGDPAYAVDGVRWPCGPELPPIEVLRKGALPDTAIGMLDLDVTGAVSGAVRYWGLDRAPVVAFDVGHGDNNNDDDVASSAASGTAVFSQIALSVHVSHADLVDKIEFSADVDPQSTNTWRIRLTTPPPRRLLPPYRRQCIVASVNATVGGAVRSLLVRTDNLGHVLIPTAATTVAQSSAGVPPLTDIDVATGNGAVVLSGSRAWAVTNTVRARAANGKVSISGPLVDTHMLDAQVANGAVVVHAARVSGSVHGSTSNGAVDLKIVAPAAGTEIGASTSIGNVAVGVSDVPLTVRYAKLSATAMLGQATVASAETGGWPLQQIEHSAIGGSKAALDLVRQDDHPADGLIKVDGRTKVGNVKVELF
ncbi:hypothetical protein BC828DRAFT_382848 [Blastocladiella britannica]|nr:hypothetical protein BC828DRAFT_382848 [Blastocladiella britannica]